METEEIDFSRIKAPGIQKKKGKTNAQNPKIEGVIRKISNEIETNFRNLDFLNYDFNVVKEFENCLKKKFGQISEMAEVRQITLKEASSIDWNKADLVKTINELAEVYQNNTKFIEDIENSLKLLNEKKYEIEQESRDIRSFLLRLMMDEDNLLRSIDNYKMKTTENLMQQTELIKKKEERTIAQIKNKIEVFDRRKPQILERIIEKKTGINWFFIIIGAVLVVFLSRLI